LCNRPGIWIGCAGWNIPGQHVELFPREGSHLARYQRQFNAVEVNTSFYRPHRPSTYARWAAESSEDFRFAVKAPQLITHEHRLRNAEEPLQSFLAEVHHLDERLGPLLFQLPPSLRFHASSTSEFLDRLREKFDGKVAWEPRHESWLDPSALKLLTKHRVALVAADPPLSQGIMPGGDMALVYYRFHGSPTTYYSDYAEDRLQSWAAELLRHADLGRQVWCIFDNTAAGAAQLNALTMQRLLDGGSSPSAKALARP
jgi:uncharacterized protein YecE (DUF72 family)